MVRCAGVASGNGEPHLRVTVRALLKTGKGLTGYAIELPGRSEVRVRTPCEQTLPGHGGVYSSISLGPDGPAKIEEVTLMRPFHGNL